MKNNLIYIRIKFKDRIKFDSPGEASYEIINYFATKVADDKYKFVWNAKSEFITGKFISMEENFINNSIDMCVIGNFKTFKELKLLIENNIIRTEEVRIL